MSGPISLEAEEPVRANSNLEAVDEARKRLTLAEFSEETVCRYTFFWPHRDSRFPSQSVDLLQTLAAHNPEPASLVAGWPHDATGSLRLRHQMLTFQLQQRGWQLVVDSGVGVASKALPAELLRETLDFLGTLGVGWFVAYGAWCSADVLSKPPFAETIRLFCRSHRLAPSHEFLRGLGARDGAVAYPLSRDDREPRLILVTPRPIRDRLEPLVESKR